MKINVEFENSEEFLDFMNGQEALQNLRSIDETLRHKIKYECTDTGIFTEDGKHISTLEYVRSLISGELFDG